jgi:hypothetical protein
MASVLITTADAVVAELNNPTGHTWSKQFTAERNFGDWKWPLESAEDEIKVEVVPMGAMAEDIETRHAIKYFPIIKVVVRYKLRQADGSEDTGRPEDVVTDELINLLEEINDHFAFRRFEDAVWEKAEIAPVAVEHLANPRQYTGFVQITYRVPKVVR